jgi:hypothetical protein
LFQESPKRFQGSEYSRKLEAVLAQEFDENHLTDMLDLANIQDDLWHRICVGNEKEGSSYLDQYPGRQSLQVLVARPCVISEVFLILSALMYLWLVLSIQVCGSEEGFGLHGDRLCFEIG